MDIYTNGIKKLRKNGIIIFKILCVGGCDVALLFLWQQTVLGKIRNTAIPIDNVVFDHMVSKGEVYEINEYVVDQRFAVGK